MIDETTDIGTVKQLVLIVRCGIRLLSFIVIQLIREKCGGYKCGAISEKLPHVEKKFDFLAHSSFT